MRRAFNLKTSAALTWFVALAVGCQPAAPPAPSKGGGPGAPTPPHNTRTTDAPAASEPAAEPKPDAEPAATPSEPATPPAKEGGEAKESADPEPAAAAAPALKVESAPFGKTADGQEVTLYTLTNGQGLSVKLIDFGATVIAVETPDKNGKSANITLGFPALDGYLQRHPYFGSTVGRFCNRIAGGKFSLDGQEFTLATNNAPNHLHGGKVGFDAKLWKATSGQSEGAAGVEFTLVSPDGDEGYPGELTAVVTYSINAANELSIDYKATTTKPTVVNLTNHCYWNLGGAGSGDVLGHLLEVAADQYLPVNETSIPTGKLLDVADTPFDFREAKAIGLRIKELAGDPGGYDHCYALRKGEGLRLAAKVTDPGSGRVMEIHTTEPGIQFYTGNYLAGSPAENGFAKHGAFCLETQHFPDAPNQPEFKSTRLNPGDTFTSKTVHKFSVAK